MNPDLCRNPLIELLHLANVSLVGTQIILPDTGITDSTWNLNGDKYEAVLNDPGFGPEAYEASFLDTDVRIRRAGAAFDIYLPDDSNPKTLTIRVDKGQIHLSVTRKKWQAVKVS